MISKPKIYAMIPARIGSTRFKMKNLALLIGKPMIAYAILGSSFFKGIQQGYCQF
jgi:CMP-N-acetylneuraminic acid synthetase